MSTSVKMIAPSDPVKSVFITYEAGWKNTRIYLEGKVVKTFENTAELKNGVQTEIENLGTLELKLNPTTLSLSASLDGERLVREKMKSTKEKGTLGVISVFSIIAVVNLISMIIALSENTRPSPERTSLIVIPGLFFVFYLVSAILFGNKIYFFYFAATGVYLLKTLHEISLILEINYYFVEVFIFYIIPRFVLLAILGLYTKRIIKLMRAPSGEASDEILDENI